MSTIEKDDWAIAVHEAGHFVAKWALVGYEACGDNLSIVADPASGILGSNSPLYEDNVSEEGIRAYIVSLYAGATAEGRVSSDLRSIKEGARTDDDQASQYLHLMADSEEQFRNQAQAIIDRHWQVVERIARELIKYRTLIGPELDFLVENEMKELKQYRMNFLNRD